MKEKEIQNKLQSILGKNRYEHTLGVAYTAAAMAMNYDEDIDSAYLAGLLHDCAKGYTIERQMELCCKYGIAITDGMAQSPQIIHQSLGSVLANKVYQVEDQRICDAIEVHTTGKPNMTLLDKIIFISDYIEPNRPMIEGLAKARKLAFHNIDQCMVHILKSTIDYLKQSGKSLDSSTVETYNYYK
ncbi:MAG: bis(5'-nucleosyl)-tetraphosphatase (symmetrical) YqeK [Anaerostipes sp.]|jgi:predicted HD superfamily hydrolase involved in NAD metabolism|nr:bis(5'-nucleosyl)-tetraphosphatase (symmetrical) YqeK [Anaerostipes sp.]MDD3746064.1 bis(5'-nucleosyl)-tetraphosphatase (symmetrical) YqeK [Anaerostipes sp.]